MVVDYSHTEDALRNAISVARTLEAKRVITLFRMREATATA